MNDVFWVLFGYIIMMPVLEISLDISSRLIQVQCCWKRCQRMLFCESADMPEDIAVDWSLSFPRSVDYTVMHYRIYIMCVLECYKTVKSLIDDHPSFTTTPM